MPSISEIIRSVGNDRAVANAQREILRVQREEWLVASLTLRLDRSQAEAPPAHAVSTETRAA